MHGPTCIFWANLTPFSLQDAGPAALGGSLLVVDLAGADYDKRSAKEGQKVRRVLGYL
jgi:hypothetical protein